VSVYLLVSTATAESANKLHLHEGIGVFQAFYQDNYLQGFSPSAISWIASLELAILFGGVRSMEHIQRRRFQELTISKGFIVGRIYDKFGPRWLLAFGTFMHVFGLMMASLSTKYYQIILSQGICSPIGICCLFTPGGCFLFDSNCAL